MDLGEFLVVHAGIRPARPIKRQTIEDLTQLRIVNGEGSKAGTPRFERYRGKKTVIFGHWVFDAPVVRKNAIGIDTGCVYGGRLTAIILPECRLVSIPALKAYAYKKGRAHVFKNENVWQAPLPWPSVYRRRD
jgi:serine/threonine protein phosphatase 1